MSIIDEIISSTDKCSPSVSEIQNFIGHILKFYNSTIGISKTHVDLYNSLLTLEQEYVVDNNDNYASIVHQLHEEIYLKDSQSKYNPGKDCLIQRLKCYHCSTRLLPSEGYSVHILNEKSKCRVCGDEVSFESMNVMAFRKDFDDNRFGSLLNSNLKMYNITITDNWKEFCEVISPNLERSRGISKEQLHARAAFAASTSGTVKALALSSPTQLITYNQSSSSEILLGGSPVSPSISSRNYKPRSPSSQLSPISPIRPISSPAPASSHNYESKANSPDLEDGSQKAMNLSVIVPNSPLSINSESSRWSESSDAINSVDDIVVRKNQVIRMINEIHGNISKFGVDLVQEMYLHLELCSLVNANAIYWQSDTTISEMILRYHKFMVLLRKRKYGKARSQQMKPLVPTIDILIVWLAHKLNKTSYQEYNKTVNGLFKIPASISISETDIYSPVSAISCTKSLNPSSSFPLSDSSLYAKTFIRWARFFNEPYATVAPKYISWQSGHNALSLCVPPIGVYRLSKWFASSEPMPSPSNASVIGTPLLGVKLLRNYIPRNSTRKDGILDYSKFEEAVKVVFDNTLNHLYGGNIKDVHISTSVST